MAEAAVVARAKKKAAEAGELEDEDDVPNLSSRPMMRSKSILDKKFKEYQVRSFVFAPTFWLQAK